MKSSKVFSHSVLYLKRFSILLFTIFTFLSIAISVLFSALSINRPYVGVGLSLSEQEWIVDSAVHNSLGINAGMRVGDKPIEVNGQSANVFLEKYVSAGQVSSKLIFSLTVVNDAGEVISVNNTRDSTPWQSNFEAIILLITCLLFWVIGFYVLFKSPQKASLLLCLCGLSFGLVISANLAAERVILYSMPIAVVTRIIAPWVLLNFFILLPEENNRFNNKLILFLIYLPVTVIIILLPLMGYANGQPLPVLNTVRLLLDGVALLSVISIVIYNYFCSISLKTRQQMKVILIGSIIAIVPIVIFNIIPVAIWNAPIVPGSICILFIASIPISMGYAIVTQRLFDIDVIIRRGIVYTLITLAMAIVLSISIFHPVFLNNTLSIPQQVGAVLLLGGLAAALFGPAKSGIEFLVDKYFYKDRYDYRNIIQSLTASLNSLNEFSDISRVTVGTTVNTLNLSGGCLFVRNRHNTWVVSAAQGIFNDDERQRVFSEIISKNNDSLTGFPNSVSTEIPGLAFIVPLVIKEKEIGFLFLSQKASKQEFNSNDIYLLQGIASVASIALHSAILVHDVSMKDTFVSVASHELRTPLTSVVGYSELLLKRNPNDETKQRWLQNIYDNSKRLANMVDELLNVTRIHSGKLNIKMEEVDLSETINEALLLLKEHTEKHSFSVEIEPDLTSIMVDRDKFVHIISNLLSNAVKYSPNGGNIKISAYKGKKDQQWIIVSVADQGIGIDQADIKSLFQTFQRIRRPETEGIKGSGLGLYISKEWVEAMGGDIWVESEINRGSTFYIGFPLTGRKM